MLSLTSLPGNSQRLDGGAMFGNAPRAVWQKWYPPDEQGRIALSCRAFLIEDGQRRVLIETGVGSFFPPHLRERYGVMEEEHVLLQSLAAVGLAPEDIDVVFLSHLHFDHAGGLLSSFEEGRPASLVFPRARFCVGQAALERARAPHPRDRASFIPDLLPLLEASGRLSVIASGSSSHPDLGERIFLRESLGHTPGMLLPTVLGKAHVATFCADLVPGSAWVHLPITMGYDRFPEQLIDEKKALFEEVGVGSWLLFTHDPSVAAGRLALSQNRYAVDDTRPHLEKWDLDA
jgi:glyoxylase-like metal-dependent hydrolase (beta-lactamase superfamily II)